MDDALQQGDVKKERIEGAKSEQEIASVPCFCNASSCICTSSCVYNKWSKNVYALRYSKMIMKLQRNNNVCMQAADNNSRMC